MIDKMLLDWAAVTKKSTSKKLLWGLFITYWNTKDYLLQTVFRAAWMGWAVAVWLRIVGFLHFLFALPGLSWVKGQYQQNPTKNGRTSSSVCWRYKNYETLLKSACIRPRQQSQVHHSSNFAMRAKGDIFSGQPQYLLLQSLFDKNSCLHIPANQPANEKYRSIFADIGKKPIVPDLHKTKW